MIDLLVVAEGRELGLAEDVIKIGGFDPIGRKTKRPKTKWASYALAEIIPLFSSHHSGPSLRRCSGLGLTEGVRASTETRATTEKRRGLAPDTSSWLARLATAIGSSQEAGCGISQVSRRKIVRRCYDWLPSLLRRRKKVYLAASSRITPRFLYPRCLGLAPAGAPGGCRGPQRRVPLPID